jgi:hypothetical protein
VRTDSWLFLANDGIQGVTVSRSMTTVLAVPPTPAHAHTSVGGSAMLSRTPSCAMPPSTRPYEDVLDCVGR